MKSRSTRESTPTGASRQAASSAAMSAALVETGTSRTNASEAGSTPTLSSVPRKELSASLSRDVGDGGGDRDGMVPA